MPFWILTIVLVGAFNHQTALNVQQRVEAARHRAEVEELRKKQGDGALDEFKERLRVL